jgi:hypothetical protein
MVLSIGKVSYNVIVRVRGANNVAQTLARECISNKLSYNCIDEPPEFCFGIIVGSDPYEVGSRLVMAWEAMLCRYWQRYCRLCRGVLEKAVKLHVWTSLG